MIQNLRFKDDGSFNNVEDSSDIDDDTDNDILIDIESCFIIKSCKLRINSYTANLSKNLKIRTLMLVSC